MHMSKNGYSANNGFKKRRKILTSNRSNGERFRVNREVNIDEQGLSELIIQNQEKQGVDKHSVVVHAVSANKHIKISDKHVEELKKKYNICETDTIKVTYHKTKMPGTWHVQAAGSKRNKLKSAGNAKKRSKSRYGRAVLKGKNKRPGGGKGDIVDS